MVNVIRDGGLLDLPVYSYSCEKSSLGNLTETLDFDYYVVE